MSDALNMNIIYSGFGLKTDHGAPGAWCYMSAVNFMFVAIIVSELEHVILR